MFHKDRCVVSCARLIAGKRWRAAHTRCLKQAQLWTQATSDSSHHSLQWSNYQACFVLLMGRHTHARTHPHAHTRGAGQYKYKSEVPGRIIKTGLYLSWLRNLASTSLAFSSSVSWIAMETFERWGACTRITPWGTSACKAIMTLEQSWQQLEHVTPCSALYGKCA